MAWLEGGGARVVQDRAGEEVEDVKTRLIATAATKLLDCSQGSVRIICGGCQREHMCQLQNRCEASVKQVGRDVAKKHKSCNTSSTHHPHENGTWVARP